VKGSRSAVAAQLASLGRRTVVTFWRKEILIKMCCIAWLHFKAVALRDTNNYMLLHNILISTKKIIEINQSIIVIKTFNYSKRIYFRRMFN